jgi:lysophospholipase L1-like esterase
MKKDFLMVSIFYSFVGLSLLILLSCGGGGVNETPKATQSETNHTPVAFAGPNQTVLTGSIVTLDGSGSYDPDNDSLTYSWALTQVPNGSTAILSNSNAVRTTFIPNVSGVYVAKLVVDSKAKTGPTSDEGPQQDTVSDASYVTITASNTLEPPLPPSDVSVIAGDRQVIIHWSAQETGGAVTSYNIYWSAIAGVTKQSGIKISGANNPYTHKDLTNGVTYYYVVASVNDYGEGRASAEVSATPFPQALSASVTIPVNLKDIFVAMGGSITKGYPLSNYDDCYVVKLSKKWGKTAVNKGATGATSSDGKSIIESILSQYNPRYLTLYYGTNDIGYYNNDLIVNNLRFIITKAKGNGTIPVVATLGPFLGQSAWRQPIAAELNKKIRQMAVEMGIACADLEAALNGNSAYMNADGMHPNSAGHQVIADAFYKALTQ